MGTNGIISGKYRGVLKSQKLFLRACPLAALHSRLLSPSFFPHFVASFLRIAQELIN